MHKSGSRIRDVVRLLKKNGIDVRIGNKRATCPNYSGIGNGKKGNLEVR